MNKSLLILPVLVVLASILTSVYYDHLSAFLNYFLRYKPVNLKSEKLFTPDQLLLYNSILQPELYLALLGIVFNVTKGMNHYGPGQTYNVFVGRDASRSFVTGKFDAKDVSDDVAGLTSQELLSLSNWLQFYKREYTKVGKLVGRYYDANGKPTQYNKEIKRLIKAAEAEKDKEEVDKVKFPPCNVEWSAEHGSRVWCTRRSGGIERSWIGVPRKLYEPGSEAHRCACIREEDKSLGNIEEYEGCNPKFDSCFVKT